MAVFPSLDPNPAKAGLAEMLAALQRQGAAQTAAVGPMLNEGVAQMLQGFQRQGEIGRQREFSAGEAEKQRTFSSDQERQRQAFEKMMDWSRRSVEGARERRGQQFAMTEAAKVRGAQADTQLMGDLRAQLGNLTSNFSEEQRSGVLTPERAKWYLDNITSTQKELTDVIGRVRGRGRGAVPQGAPPPMARPGPAISTVLTGGGVPTTQEQERAVTEAGTLARAEIPKDKATIARSFPLVMEKVAREPTAVFGASDPTHPTNRFYKLMVADLEDGMDEQRVYQRAKDRLADAKTYQTLFGRPPVSQDFQTEIGSAMPAPTNVPPSSVPTDGEIAAFIKVAMKRLGKS